LPVDLQAGLNRRKWFHCNPTAVPELLFPGTVAAEWRFSQENATFRGFQKGTLILEPL
jgi:hypothetical protein